MSGQESTDTTAGGSSTQTPANEKAAVPAPSKDHRPVYRRPALVGGALIVLTAAVIAGIYYFQARNFEQTDDAYIEGHVISIMPQVSAKVAAIHINDNQLVHQGDLLVELDQTDYQVAVAQMSGAEAAAQGKLDQARSGVPSAQSAVAEAQAGLASSQVNLDNASRDLQRYSSLDERAKSQQQLDNAKAAQKRAEADVEQAQAHLQSARDQVATAEANVTVAEGQLQQAHADSEKARVNLGYCRVIAPCDGRVTNKNVDPGLYVSSASQLFSLVPADVWVIANFKETQLTRMQPGQRVTIDVDAFPDRDFRGVVDSIQAGSGSRFSIIPAENATGNFVKVVQRVPVKIRFDGNVNSDPNHVLAPGMSVEPKVQVR